MNSDGESNLSKNMENDNQKESEELSNENIKLEAASVLQDLVDRVVAGLINFIINVHVFKTVLLHIL